LVILSPPPAPKMCSAWPHLEQKWRLIFDDAEARDANLLELFESIPRIQQGDVLRRGDDDGTGHRLLTTRST
jgi:hypothetical protein